MKRFLIADDHTFIRYAVKEMLTDSYPGSHLEEVASAEELLLQVSKGVWDLIILDITMPGRNGVEVLPEIRLAYPKLPVLVLSMHPERLYATRVIKASAAGYLQKGSGARELVKAVDALLQGKKYLTTAAAEQLAATVENKIAVNPHEILSDREFEIMKLIAAGISLTGIAGRLLLGLTTVSTYRSRLLKKLQVTNNAELRRYAIAHGLL